MAGYQRFRILTYRLKSFDDVREVLWILNEHIHLHCDVEGIQPGFRRDDEWGCYPAIQIRRRAGYILEVGHTGYYLHKLINKLLIVKKRLKKRFPFTKVYYLNIEKLNKI
jgi:hypothetical protein